MGFDQRLNQIDMISTSRSCEIFKSSTIQKKCPMRIFEIGIKWDISNRNTSNVKSKKKSKTNPKPKSLINEVEILMSPSRIFGEKIDIEITKKGGHFKLIGGCNVTIEEQIFVKKGSISCYMIPPNKRQDFPITLQYQEFLVSEIFLISSKVFLKKPIKIFIPSVTNTNRYCYLLSCITENFQWVSVPNFDFNTEGITFWLDKWGYFAIVERQPFENIKITSNGGLINTRIHPMVSLRIPKNSSPVDDVCSLQYLKNSKTIIEEMSECYPLELGNILNVSSMVSLGFPAVQLKRHMTIKLPLPEWAEERVENNENIGKNSELMLLCKRQGNWEPIDSRISFTKNTFTFESKVFGTFILVEPKSNREGKVRHSLSRIEYVNNILKGVILVFLFIESKSWYLWVELVSVENAPSMKSDREERGLIFIQQFIPVISIKIDKGRRRSNLIPTRNCTQIAELSDGMIFTMTLEGDVEFKPSTLKIPIISKAYQKSVEFTLKKQSLITVSNLQKFTQTVSNDEVDENTADDFLMQMGKKEKPVIVNTKDDNENSLPCTSIIFYRSLQENYRIIEIQPKKKLNFEIDITDKWKQKEIYKLEQAENTKVDISNTDSTNISEPEFILKTSTDEDPHNLDDLFMEKLLRANTVESKARVNLSTEEIEHNFSAILSINRESFCFQLPPNQFGPDVDIDKLIKEEDRLKYLSSYLPPDVTQTTYQYKFYMEPEEMREYLGISKPTNADITKAKQEKADRHVVKYLKDYNPEVDKSLLDEKKKKTIKSFEDNLNLNAPSATESKKNKVESRTKVYKEPKVLSGRSLETLSHYVENGLTLAVLLNIPDSEITGIGFDCLSSHQTLAEVTNKVLSHWKRIVSVENRPNMLQLLIQSLKEMHLNSLADAIQFAGNNNEELTNKHFNKSPDYLTEKLSEAHIKKQKESVISFKKNPMPGDLTDLSETKEEETI